MPCDLGYKSFSTVTVPVPTPTVLQKSIAAPAVDAELMKLIGQDDPQFLEWMNDLETAPLLQKALDVALESVGATLLVNFSVTAAGLTAKALYLNQAEKDRAERAIEKVSRRWQVEVLAIVAQLLDFDTQVTVTGVGANERLMLEGEKHSPSRVNEYLRVTFDPTAGTTMLFEHFASKEKVDAMRNKFQALSERLGVPINVVATQQSGSPIPEGAVHEHFIKHHGHK